MFGVERGAIRNIFHLGRLSKHRHSPDFPLETISNARRREQRRFKNAIKNQQHRIIRGERF